MRNPSASRQSHSSTPRRPSSREKGFRPFYVVVLVLTAAAIATPPAIAANLMPNSNVGALMMILSVAVLMFVLVIEIWRHTASNTGPVFDPHSRDRRKKPGKTSR